LTQHVIVFAAADDVVRATDAVRAAGDPNPLVVTLQQEAIPLRHGEALVAIGFWSEATSAARLASRLEAHLTQHPSRSILCVLDDLPLEPVWTHLDPGVMILRASSSDRFASALASALELARRRTTAIGEIPTSSPSRGLGAWTTSAIAVGFLLVLSAAGVAAWVSDPPLPEDSVSNTESTPPPDAPLAVDAAGEQRKAHDDAPRDTEGESARIDRQDAAGTSRQPSKPAVTAGAKNTQIEPVAPASRSEAATPKIASPPNSAAEARASTPAQREIAGAGDSHLNDAETTP